MEAVERVVRMVAITPAPQAPDLVLGVIDLQGVIVPVLDLRRRLELPDKVPSLDDRIVIVGRGRQRLAFVVDDVAGLLTPEAARVTTSGDIGAGMECLAGVVHSDTGLVLLIDLDRMLDFKAGESWGEGTS